MADMEYIRKTNTWAKGEEHRVSVGVGSGSSLSPVACQTNRNSQQRKSRMRNNHYKGIQRFTGPLLRFAQWSLCAW